MRDLQSQLDQDGIQSLMFNSKKSLEVEVKKVNLILNMKMSVLVRNQEVKVKARAKVKVRAIVEIMKNKTFNKKLKELKVKDL